MYPSWLADQYIQTCLTRHENVFATERAYFLDRTIQSHEATNGAGQHVVIALDMLVPDLRAAFQRAMLAAVGEHFSRGMQQHVGVYAANAFRNTPRGRQIVVRQFLLDVNAISHIERDVASDLFRAHADTRDSRDMPQAPAHLRQ